MPLKIIYECPICSTPHDLAPGTSIRDYASWCFYCRKEGCRECHFICSMCRNEVCPEHMNADEHICTQCHIRKIFD